MQQKVIRSHPEDEPYLRLWQQAAVEHPTYDEFWAERDARPGLADVTIPVYLGCDWDNAIMPLPGTFTSWRALAHNPHVRMSLLPAGGLSWPWESIHYGALACKGRDTGSLDGPPIRYYLPDADEWRTAEVWPPGDSSLHPFALRTDGVLGEDEGEPGSRSYLCLTGEVGRPVHANPPTLPAQLDWQTEPMTRPLDFAGDIELRLDAAITATDTGWIAVLYDVAPDGTSDVITGGWLRATLRTVNEQRSIPGAPGTRIPPQQHGRRKPQHDPLLVPAAAPRSVGLSCHGAELNSPGAARGQPPAARRALTLATSLSSARSWVVVLIASRIFSADTPPSATASSSATAPTSSLVSRRDSNANSGM